MKIRIATRKSPLALWQANFVKEQLLRKYNNLSVELVPMETQGDVLLDSPLSKIGGKGLFVKQLESAILNGQADIAVHSIKDIPTEFPEGLCLATICKRDEVKDALVSNYYHSLDELPRCAVVGTSSLRRQSQLRAAFPHFQIKDLRGNVGTRLSKLDNNEYDAIILAAAGLHRLGLSNKIKQYIPTDIMLPAVGQGAVGIESRSSDKAILKLLAPLDDMVTRSCVTAERAMNARLQGGCQVPIACYSQLDNNALTLEGLVGRVDGSLMIKDTVQGNINDAEKLGDMLAEKLLQQGAKSILDNLIAQR